MKPLITLFKGCLRLDIQLILRINSLDARLRLKLSINTGILVNTRLVICQGVAGKTLAERRLYFEIRFFFESLCKVTSFCLKILEDLAFDFNT